MGVKKKAAKSDKKSWQYSNDLIMGKKESMGSEAQTTCAYAVFGWHQCQMMECGNEMEMECNGISTSILSLQELPPGYPR